MRPDSPSPVIPFLIACAGIATFSAMDVLMKGLSIEIGAYNAVLCHAAIMRRAPCLRRPPSVFH